MYKYIALTALVLGSAALGFNINRGGEEQFTLAKVENHGESSPYYLFRDVFDIDQDGLGDLFRYASEDDSGLLYLELKARMNLGDMSFSPWETIGTYELDILPEYAGSSSVNNWSICDLNGDSYPDLILNVYEYVMIPPDDELEAYATVYLINNGSGGFTCAGDVTGDGTTDVNDLLGVIGDWGCIEEGQPD